jgi:phosphoglycerate dehydrogenase-like enzyme
MAVLTLDIVHGRLRATRIIANPEKLRAVSPLPDEGGHEVDPKEILVTGGTGSLGRRVVDRLRAAGREVRVLSRSGRPGTVRGDLSTGENLEVAVGG